MLFLGTEFDIFYNSCKSLLFNKDLLVLFSTLMAGLFGFVIAIIPLAIHIFSQNTDFINKLTEQDSLNFYIKPLFNRFISFLKNMFYLFIFMLFVLFIKDIIPFESDKHTEMKMLVIALCFIYILLIKEFLYNIHIIIKYLQILIQIFLKSKNKRDV